MPVSGLANRHQNARTSEEKYFKGNNSGTWREKVPVPLNGSTGLVLLSCPSIFDFLINIYSYSYIFTRINASRDCGFMAPKTLALKFKKHSETWGKGVCVCAIVTIDMALMAMSNHAVLLRINKDKKR